MCVLYKLLHLHCIFEAHPFEIVRLQSSSEGSVKEANRSLSEGKVFGQAVGLRIARYGKVRGGLGSWVMVILAAASDKAPERRRGSWRFLELMKTLLLRRKTNEILHQRCKIRVFCFGKDIANRFDSLLHVPVYCTKVPTSYRSHSHQPLSSLFILITQPLCYIRSKSSYVD